MNKKELSAMMANTCDYSPAQMEEIITALFMQIQSSVKEGETVEIAKFGKFSAKLREEREGRHPGTGAAITIAAAYVPGFKASKAFKDFLNPKETI